MPMGTYTKIKVIMLYTLNNAEYLAYMNSMEAMEFVKQRMEQTVDNMEFLASMNG